ncbi:MAG: hypothetical protein HC819_12035 [Cyclobacteriaceae bacterium]|nr:hypothetical protein [Cyclobacteriaceae bacterium]
MANKRNYPCNDVDMLMASKTIAESFKTNIAELSVTRSLWTEQFAYDLISRIDSAIETHLGIDVKKALRDATASLSTIQVPAKRDVSYFKIQIEEDFKKEPSKRDEILKNLGFTKHIRDVQKGNQESLIQLLYQFKINMSDTLRQEIVAKGLNTTLIDNIIGYANTFKQANVTQETFKSATKEVAKEVNDAFTAIYDEIIAICKIASKYYKYEPLKKEQFTFAKALSNLGASTKVTGTETTQAAI